jgi:hypothetical protein
MSKKHVKVLFDPRRTQLAEEVKNHPELCQILGELAEQGIDGSEFEVRLAAVAKYCKIGLDGTYLPEDLSKLCDILTEKLRKARTIVFS